MSTTRYTNVVNPSDDAVKFLLDHCNAPDTFGTHPVLQFLLSDFPARIDAWLHLFSEKNQVSESALISLAYHHGFLTYLPPGEKVMSGRQFLRSDSSGKLGLIAQTRTYRKLFLESALFF